MTTYIATAQDGSKITRKSDRVYTHAVVGTWDSKEENAHYGYLGFCGSLALAEKLLASKDRKPYVIETYPNRDFVIVEVEVAA
jgi:hypothetical protein